MAGRTGGFSFFSNILIAVVQSPLVTDQLSKHWSDLSDCVPMYDACICVCLWYFVSEYVKVMVGW